MEKGFLNPEEVLNQLDLEEKMIAAEFGCGSGGFTIPLAKRLKDGKVFGLDIQEEMLSALKSRASVEKVFNIQTIRCDLEKPNGSTLKDNSLDLVLIPNVLFQVEDKNAILKEAKRILKKEGKILVIDWKIDAPLGPKEGRVSEKEVKELAKELGLKTEKEFPAGAYHFSLILVK